MSARQEGYRAIHVSAGTFPTFEAAVKAANALKIWLKRLLKRKGYTCEAIIGVSENNPHTGEVTSVKTGKRGRPKKAFVRTNGTMQPTMTEPHLHIVIHGEPAETIAKEIAAYFNHTYGKGKRIAWVKNCGGYVETVTRYILKQSLKIRTVNCENGDDFGAFLTDTFLFTPSGAEATEQTAEKSEVCAIQTDAAALPYKSYKVLSNSLYPSLCDKKIYNSSFIPIILFSTVGKIKNNPSLFLSSFNFSP